MQYDLTDDDERKRAYDELAKMLMLGKTVEIKAVKNTRTLRQNSALHKYFELLADELNNAGYDLHKTLSKDIEIPWNADLIKKLIWRPVMKAKLDKDSTTQMTTKEIDEVFDVINRYTGDKFGIHVPFPSIENRG